MSSEAQALPSDEELMKAYCSEGSDKAFKHLYARYEKRLFNFLKKRLASSKTETVNDLFQKTWLKIHASRHQFDPTKTFSAWFYTIALNTLRDHVGSAAEKLPFEELEDGTISTEPVPAREDQEQRLLLKEDWARAEAALALLPGNQKEAFLLSEWEGLTSREIGEVLGISEAAVRQLLARARSKLRSILKEASHA